LERSRVERVEQRTTTAMGDGRRRGRIEEDKDVYWTVGA